MESCTDWGPLKTYIDGSIWFNERNYRVHLSRFSLKNRLWFCEISSGVLCTSRGDWCFVSNPNFPCVPQWRNDGNWDNSEAANAVHSSDQVPWLVRVIIAQCYKTLVHFLDIRVVHCLALERMRVGEILLPQNWVSSPPKALWDLLCTETQLMSPPFWFTQLNLINFLSTKKKEPYCCSFTNWLIESQSSQQKCIHSIEHLLYTSSLVKLILLVHTRCLSAR